MILTVYINNIYTSYFVIYRGFEFPEGYIKLCNMLVLFID